MSAERPFVLTIDGKEFRGSAQDVGNYISALLDDQTATRAALTKAEEALANMATQRDDMERELEQHSTDRVNRRKEVKAANETASNLARLLGQAVKAVFHVSGPSHPLALEITDALAAYDEHQGSKAPGGENVSD